MRGFHWGWGVAKPALLVSLFLSLVWAGGTYRKGLPGSLHRLPAKTLWLFRYPGHPFLGALQGREAFIEVFAEILVEPDSGRYGAFLLAH